MIGRFELEPNQTTSQATAWNVSDPVMGILTGNGDADFFDDKEQIIAARRNDKLRVLTELLPQLTQVRSK